MPIGRTIAKLGGLFGHIVRKQIALIVLRCKIPEITAQRGKCLKLFK